MPKIRSLITRNHTGLTVGGGSSSTATERRISGEKFLKGLKSSWEDHILCMNMTGDVLMYMDRVYCTDNRRPSIFTTCMGLFRDHILRSKLVESDLDLSTFDILNSVLLDMIQMEREGDVIDKNLVRSCMYMLEGLYERRERETVFDRLRAEVLELQQGILSKRMYDAIARIGCRHLASSDSETLDGRG
jgi:cullin 3